MDPLVSIVVPSYNRRDGLGRLLDALARQTYPLDGFEVVVVDDGSTDGTAEYLAALRPAFPFRFLQQANQGPAAARNLGVRHARGTYVLFLDDDVVPDPDLVEQHLAAHSGRADTVVIGPMSPPGDWPRPIWVRWEEEMLQEQYRAMTTGEWACTARQFYTANASLHREAFLAAAGFDPRFKRAEDVELAYRLRDRGARFIFSPRANVLHYASRSFAAWSRTPYQYGRYDVVMHRDKGHEALPCATREFHDRHLLTRWLARWCVGRGPLLRGAVHVLGGAARAADRLGARGAAGLALSASFNLLYWQGVCDELGGQEPVWRLVAASAPAR